VSAEKATRKATVSDACGGPDAIHPARECLEAGAQFGKSVLTVAG
jgi:hypothetical protein